MKGDCAKGEHRPTAAPEEIEQPAVGDRHAAQHRRGKPRWRRARGGQDDRAQATDDEQRAQSLLTAEVERVRHRALLLNEARPRYRTLEYLGAQQVLQAPDLEVFCLQRGDYLDRQSALAQSPTELDVLDRRLRITHAVKATRVEKGLLAHRTTASPEGMRSALFPAMVVSVHEVLVQGQESGRRRIVVVGAEHR